MTPTPTLIEQRATLEATMVAAEEKLSEARYRARHKRAESVADVTADLASFQDSIGFNLPNASAPKDQEKRQRELTRALFKTIEERGLIVKAVSGPSGRVLSIEDPTVDGDFQAADTEAVEARTAVRDFERDNREALVAEQKAIEAEAIRTALAGDDPDAIRDALNGKADVLTSDDLAPPRQRAATAG